MKTAEFNGLIAEIKKHFERDMKNTFSVSYVYIFHDKHPDKNGKKQGISFDFNNNALDIEVFTLENLIEDNLGSRYTNSKTLSSGYYLLTHKQHMTAQKLIREKANLIVV